MIYKFPEGFYWGTATSAHQIEGGNDNTDWWEWEQSKKYPPHLNANATEAEMADLPEREWPLEPSLIACDSYNRYEEDFDLCKQMNNNVVRFSVEWARIEPEDGVFNQIEIDHYKKVLKAAKERGLKTFVTLHHFTTPTWMTKNGGWANPVIYWKFARYAKKCAQEFGDQIDYYGTINEPQVYSVMSYAWGTWPPAKRNWFLAAFVGFNTIMAHRAAYDSIKSVNQSLQVGIVKHIVWHETGNASNAFINILDRLNTALRFFLGCDAYLMMLGKKNDYIGVNYYFTEINENLSVHNKNDRVSDLGWWIYPAGLEKILIHLKKYNLPIYITENGLADEKDVYREEFIREMLISCAKAIAEGANLRGYLHWSLLDNYEWHQGYWPKFGLVEIDRKNDLERKPRKSFHYYAKICKENEVSEVKPTS